MDVSVSAQVREEQLSETLHPSQGMGLLFCVVLLWRHSIILMALHTGRSRLGSDAGRSVSPYPGSENGNASDHNSPLPPPGPKKKGRPPKNKPKGTADVFVLLCM